MADYGHVMKPNGDARVPDYVSHELPWENKVFIIIHFFIYLLFYIFFFPVIELLSYKYRYMYTLV